MMIDFYCLSPGLERDVASDTSKLFSCEGSLSRACAFIYAHAQSGGADVVRAVAIARLDALALPSFDRFLRRRR